eukprot:TRINITY_DN73009_c0_g1_i1.p1 TRINITY_DN73009_c0_g1~~TRINITY_DN73009_c0_g1_i1.p1  ORF type:complete len:1030 (+),score=446.60 TRINITY_DN73009_c0_g1_i1:44-3091(+)
MGQEYGSTLVEDHAVDHLDAQRNSRQSHRQSARASYLSMHPVAPEESVGPLVKTYVKVLDEFMVKWVVIAFFLITTAISINWALELFDKTDMKWNAPSGSYAEDQENMVKKYMPTAVGSTEFLVALEWKVPKQSDNIVKYTPSFASLDLPEPVFEAGGVQYTYSNAGSKDFTEALRERIYYKWCGVLPNITRISLSQGVPPNCAAFGNRVSLYTGYWAVVGYDETAGNAYLGKGNTSTYIAIKLQGENIGLSDIKDEFSDWLDETVDLIAPQFLNPVQMKGGAFSISGGTKQILSTVKSDLILADGIAIPVSLIISMIALRNLRLMIVPLTMCLVTTFVSMAIVTGLAENMAVSVLSPLVMISIIVALPVGHSLFFLNRFREALLEDFPVPEAVKRMLSTAGMAVFLSQLCLAGCCVIIIFVDVEQVQSMGAAMLVSVCVSALSAMVLAPSILLAFPNFFQNCRERTEVLGKMGVWRKRDTVALATQLKGGAPKYDSEDPGVVPHLMPELADTKWHRFANRTQEASGTFSCLALLVLFVFISPFAIVLFKNTEVTDSFTVYLPRRDDFTETAFRLFDAFGYGIASQYTVMALPPVNSLLPADAAAVLKATGQNIGDEPYSYFVLDTDLTAQDTVWNNAAGFFDQLKTSPNYDTNDVVGAFYYHGIQFDAQSIAVAMKYLTSLAGGAPVNPALEAAYSPSLRWRAACLQSSSLKVFPGMALVQALPQYMNQTFIQAATTNINFRQDPQSASGRAFADDFKAIQESFNDAGGAQLYVAGTPINSMESVERVNSSWRWVSALFVLLAFLIVLLGTRSMMIAVRTVITTFCTVCFALGFTSLTYCHGALGWIGIDALDKFQGGELHYMVLIVAVPLLIGFSISHEVFVMSASLEWYHHHGLSSRDATKLGLVGVGWLNILSGFIIAIGFMGHVFARLPIANQIAFALFWGSLFDVLIIRTVVAPLLMAPLGPNNWWPNHVRKTDRSYSQCRDSTVARSQNNPLDSVTMVTKRTDEGETA